MIVKEKEHQQREKDLEQKQKQRRLLRLEIINIIESLPFLILAFIFTLSLGIFLGVNIADVSGCYEQNTLCQLMRWRKKINY